MYIQNSENMYFSAMYVFKMSLPFPAMVKLVAGLLVFVGLAKSTILCFVTVVNLIFVFSL